ncbi:hypothetical protein F4824DRAFT_497559 [Ustulina deusta]|nr:hypothetical protein F4823DRAFT_641000 [Ustulina deusta]KAI3339989.1 hypothetical protein F4824DRAFT_497559 [Ustulina deusta]
MTSVVSSTGLLVYRKNSDGKTELLVRFRASDRTPVYSTPFRDLEPDQTAIDCAQRMGAASLGLDLTERDLNLKESVLINSTGKPKKVRVFLVRSTPQFEALAQREDVRGWKYAFIPLSSLHSVWLSPELEASKEALKFALASLG